MTKKIFLTIYILSLIISSFIFHQNVLAQNSNLEYTVLAPLPCINGSASGADCSQVQTKTTLEMYLPGMFRLLIGIAGVFAVLMIVVGGFQYMTTDSLQGKQDGKQRVYNAVKGLVLVIAAWLILYTVNPALLELKLEIAPVSIDKSQSGTLSPTSSGVPMTPEQIAASNAVRKELENAKVYTYAGPCERGQTTGCVNLNGLTQTTKDGLIALRNSFGSDIFITGGTEPGHAAEGSHPTGNAIDLSFQRNPSISAYVEKNKIGNPIQISYGTLYKMKINGRDADFVKEDDHWHIIFK